MIWDIYTYGDGKTIATLFNGIASFFGGNDWQDLARLALSIAAMTLVLQLGKGAKPVSQMTKFIMWTTFMSTALLGVKSTVKIVDVINPSNIRVVQNVPFGLAMFAGTTSQIGRGLTKIFEMTLSIPGDRKFEKHGMLFGSRLLSDTAMFEIRDYEFRRSVGDYAYQCVLMGTNLGIVSVNEIIKSNDIWHLAKTRLSQKSRAFSYWEKESSGRVKRRLVNCKVGVGLLESKWKKILEEAATYYGKKQFPYVSNLKAKTLLLQELPIVYSSVLGVSKNALEIMRQGMMVNAIQTGGAARMTDKMSADNFLSNRITIQESFKNRGFWDMAGRKVISSFSILSGVLYISFPIIVVLAYVMGFAVIKEYIVSLLTIQMLPVFWAVINVFHVGQEDSKYQSFASMGLTMVNQPRFVLAHQDLSATAGFMAFMIMPIVFMVIRGGISSLSGLATGAAMNSLGSAQQASSELASGNVSMGNTSFDTNNAYNASVGQRRLGSTFDNRVTTTDTMGGTVMQGSSNNTTYAGAVSSGMLSGIVSSNYGSQLQNSYNTSLSALERDSASYSEALHNTEGTNHDWRTTSGARNDQNFNKAEDTLKEWAKANNFKEEDVKSSALVAMVGGSIEPKIFKAGLEKTFTADGRKVSSEDFSTAWKNTDKSAFAEAVSKYGEYANSTSASESTQQTRDARHNLDSSLDKHETASRNLSNYESNSASINVNATEMLNRELIKEGFTYEDFSNYSPENMQKLSATSQEILHDPEFQNASMGSTVQRDIPTETDIQRNYHNTADSVAQKSQDMTKPNTEQIKETVKQGVQTTDNTLQEAQKTQSKDTEKTDAIDKKVQEHSAEGRKKAIIESYKKDKKFVSGRDKP